MRRLLRPLWVLLALVFLFEAWLWDLRPIVAWLRRQVAPIRRRLASLSWLARPKRAGRFLRRLAWLRRWMQRAPAA
jgi:hypothetical protein